MRAGRIQQRGKSPAAIVIAGFILAAALSACGDDDSSDSEVTFSAEDTPTPSADISPTPDESDLSSGEIGSAVVTARDPDGFELLYDIRLSPVVDHVAGDVLSQECGEAVNYDFLADKTVKVQEVVITAKDVTQGDFPFSGRHFISVAGNGGGTSMNFGYATSGCSDGEFRETGLQIRPQPGETVTAAYFWVGTPSPNAPTGFEDDAEPWLDAHLRFNSHNTCVIETSGTAVRSPDDECELYLNNNQ